MPYRDHQLDVSSRRTTLQPGAWSCRVVLLLTVVGQIHCDSQTSDSPGSSSLKSAPTPRTGPSASGPAPSSVQSAKPKTTSHPLAGRWRGVYKAVPTEIRLRPEAHWDAWKDGDNKKSVGGGELELRVAPDGSVRGQATGALGKLRIVGSAEGDTVRLGVEPASPEGASSMRGYAIVQRSGQRLRGQLRVSDARGLHPRAATFILKR